MTHQSNTFPFHNEYLDEDNLEQNDLDTCMSALFNIHGRLHITK